MKLNKQLLSVLVMVALLCCSLNGFAAHGEKKSEKKAILLVAFGTSVPEARKVFERIDEQTRKEFPGVEVRWAFTSKIIRAKLAKEGKMHGFPGNGNGQAHDRRLHPCGGAFPAHDSG